MIDSNGHLLTFSAQNLEETQQFADQLSQMALEELEHADMLTICLTGTLGAGKTTFVRCLCRALGVNEIDVSSPTFSLHQQYAGKNNLRINHFDFYRFDDEDQIFEIGFEETVSQYGLHLIEWGEKFADCLPESFWSLKIDVLGESKRQFTLQK